MSYNFIQLCQLLRQEAGIAGTGPSTTEGQSGELGRLVQWIIEAYEDIQLKNLEWRFLRKNFVLPLLAGQNTYPRASSGLVLSGGAVRNFRRNSLRIYTDTVSFTDELWLPNRDWDLFRDNRLRGASSTQTGRPIEFTLDPSKDIYVWPIPNYNIVPFTSGHGTQPVIGDTIINGANSAQVVGISITGGTFAGGNANGTMTVIAINGGFVSGSTLTDTNSGATMTCGTTSVNYFVRGEYYQVPDVFTGDTSLPIFDTNQLCIVYNALTRYAAYASEPALFAMAQKQCARLIAKLEADWAEKITRGGALA
jgi:hypothetical protein